MKPCIADGCTAGAVAKGMCKRHWHKQNRYGSTEGGAGWKRGESLAWLHAHADHIGDECLTWPFTRSTSGYGVIVIARRQRQAHREMCSLAHGNPPTDAHQAAHNCGKGHEGCVNPRHLRWATASANQSDRLAHGTSPRGKGNGCAALTEQQVAAIRSRLDAGETQSQLAREHGVHLSTIHLIKTGRNWGWLKENHQ